MHYVINVSKDGKHFFATHERSLQTHEMAHTVAQEVQKRFPKAEGYEVTLTCWRSAGRDVAILCDE